MKLKINILVASVMLTTTGFAQKDELKSLKKIYERSEPSDKDVNDFKENLNAIDKLVTGSTDSEKAYTAFYKSVAPYVSYLGAISKSVDKNNPQIVTEYLNSKNINEIVSGRNAILAFERKEGTATLTKGLNENAAGLKTLFVNYAVALNDKQQYKDASLILKSVYDLDNKDPEKLYYAANFALNAKDYDLALSEYQELKRINFTGESTQYYAVNKETKKEEQFNNKSERDLYVKATSHEKPRDEKSPSKKAEIVKNIALILVQSGKKQEAITAIQQARATTPDDTSLMMTEANLYYELKDIPNYQRVIKEAIDKNPNDAELYFNLGVTNSTSKNTAEAEKYFKKAIELKPDYTDAYINMSELKLRDDEKYYNEMAKLGTSAADTKKYEVIKVNRSKMFMDAIPYLEKAFELDSKNEAVAKTLLTVYKAMEMTAKVNALKAKM
jgi:tetratricopeptide (TPR) repeat protein